MKEMDFKPETGWGWFILWCGMFGTMGFVMYQELGSQALELTTWEDRIDAAVVIALMLFIFWVVCLQLIFNARRFSFTDTGFRVWTWRGPRFIPWQAIKQATLGMHHIKRTSGWICVTLLLRPGVAVDIPIELFKRRGSLLYELKRWLPVPLLDPKGLESKLMNDQGQR